MANRLMDIEIIRMDYAIAQERRKRKIAFEQYRIEAELDHTREVLVSVSQGGILQRIQGVIAKSRISL
ncbi:MAG: hypothetical protein ABSE07_02265 [Methanoregula sp.]|jgi:hypothetical protein